MPIFSWIHAGLTRTFVSGIQQLNNNNQPGNLIEQEERIRWFRQNPESHVVWENSCLIRDQELFLFLQSGNCTKTFQMLICFHFLGSNTWCINYFVSSQLFWSIDHQFLKTHWCQGQISSKLCTWSPPRIRIVIYGKMFARGVQNLMTGSPMIVGVTQRNVSISCPKIRLFHHTNCTPETKQMALWQEFMASFCQIPQWNTPAQNNCVRKIGCPTHTSTISNDML